MDWEDRLDRFELELELAAQLEGSDWVTLERAAAETGARHWVILNKTDLLAPNAVRGFVAKGGVNPLLTISAISGAGVDDLMRSLATFAEQFFTAEPALVTRQRHRVALQEAGQALDVALRLGPRGGEELVAEHIRFATRALERLTLSWHPAFGKA